jgi:hypothetical protein
MRFHESSHEDAYILKHEDAYTLNPPPSTLNPQRFACRCCASLRSHTAVAVARRAAPRLHTDVRCCGSDGPRENAVGMSHKDVGAGGYRRTSLREYSYARRCGRMQKEKVADALLRGRTHTSVPGARCVAGAAYRRTSLRE